MQNNSNIKTQVICGQQLISTTPSGFEAQYHDKNTSFCLSGVPLIGKPQAIPISYEVLSKHILLLGGIGTGKTNVFNGLVSKIKNKMTTDDVMVIFDTKGDFYDTFYKPGDIVISNDDTATGADGNNYWNIFSEIYADKRRPEAIMEISRMLFAEASKKTTQIFFPNAARGLFEACIHHFCEAVPSKRSNYGLLDYISSITAKELKEMLMTYPKFRALTSYISVDDSAQTQGVLSELQQICRDLFIGNFAEVGDLSLRNIVRNKGGKTVFIEYDLSIGKTLTPIYSLLFDLALKEALGRKRSSGNVYLITDEFRLLPYLEHIDDAVNFGRSLGVKFIMGVQNVEQIYEHYGEERARSILSGFQSLFAFKLNDAKSREHVQSFFGKNIKKISYMPTIKSEGTKDEIRDAMVVEDWDILSLKTGQAIVGLPEQEPFIYNFDLYK